MRQTPAQTPQGQAPGRGAPLPKVPPELDAGPIMKLDEAQAVAMLKDPGSTFFQRAIACKRLAVIGKKASIAPLAALLNDARMAHYGRFGLEPNPDPAVDDALRAALPKLKGRLLMGVIHSIGVRQDAKAVDALGKLMYGSDAEIAQAAAASLGSIGGAAAARLLRDGLSRTKAPVMPVLARAALQCAESLTAPQAIEMYTALSAETMPRVVRRAAFRSINADAAKSARPA